ncbi:hypothetical protein [Caldicellulosiruptor changbaiensis]|uniref:hypothetical protein n=1 Tax=Caldicellulosiruptor changbaiensis TaxID=1222016 RepID=UPI001F49A76E|nr:hypothetical protein [Caldicellulosiruptor changbaiensis]
MYRIDRNGTSRIEPIKILALSRKDDRIITASTAKVKNDQSFGLLLMVEGAKNKNSSLVITEFNYLECDSKYLEQLAKKYTHVFIVAAKLTNKLK